MKTGTSKIKNCFSADLISAPANREELNLKTGISLIDKKKWWYSKYPEHDDKVFEELKERKIKYQTYRLKREWGEDILFRYL